MSLQALVYCADEKVVRVLRRVLSELEIGMELCADAESAIHKLTRGRFEAVIVDCADPATASRVLRSARSAPCNKRAVAVAIVAAQSSLGDSRDLGAHFVLYQPLSPERAKTSFRAVRALMKRERRRNARITVETPVTIQVNDGAGQLRAVSTDIGEGGIAIQLAHRPKNLGAVKLQFVLPGTEDNIECAGDVAWENPGRQVGLRFLNLPPAMANRLNAWLESRAPEFDQDDPPAPCKLTDLSLGGCYVATASPFPVRTRIILSMKVAGVGFRAEGVVLVMHSDLGMGIEFARTTDAQRNDLEKFIQAQTSSNGTLQELMVEPEGLDIGEPASVVKSVTGVEDPLLDLFRKKSALPSAAFQAELLKQRGPNHKAVAQKASV
ncbi:MAG: PilZ domain-containing protein [Terriglobales bacterium]